MLWLPRVLAGRPPDDIAVGFGAGWIDGPAGFDGCG
jgi:hypothetical protein